MDRHEKIKAEWAYAIKQCSRSYRCGDAYKWTQLIHFYPELNSNNPYGELEERSNREELNRYRKAVGDLCRLEGDETRFGAYMAALKEAAFELQFLSIPNFTGESSYSFYRADERPITDRVDEDRYYLNQYIKLAQTHPEYLTPTKKTAALFSDNPNAQECALEWLQTFGKQVNLSERLKKHLHLFEEQGKASILKKIKAIAEATRDLRIPVAEKYIGEVLEDLGIEEPQNRERKHRWYEPLNGMSYEEASETLETLRRTLRDGSFLTVREYRQLWFKNSPIPVILICAFIIIVLALLQ